MKKLLSNVLVICIALLVELILLPIKVFMIVSEWVNDVVSQEETASSVRLKRLLETKGKKHGEK